MFRIAKTFSFAASHALTHLPASHKCHRLHGHNYTVDLELSRGHLNPDSFVKDYGELAPFRAYIDGLDHHHLMGLSADNYALRLLSDPAEILAATQRVATGEDPACRPATAERLAHHFYLVAVDLFGSDLVTAVRVHETPNTVAEYRK